MTDPEGLPGLETLAESESPKPFSFSEANKLSKGAQMAIGGLCLGTVLAAVVMAIWSSTDWLVRRHDMV